ncbi:unnamed protein product [Phytomonas sp. EM1]|nr:unnamed protein product [Phytomonas sp. EM1]|eukprot:CCW61745.1 unnamed protein product [Phytomonas sp. isolate EM1]
MHFFKRAASSQNLDNVIKEDREQRASSQKPEPQPSMIPQSFPGMAQSLTRPLFRGSGASVSPPATRQAHSNAVSDADAGLHSRVQGTAGKTVETTSQLVKDITSRCDTVLERAQNLLTRAKEQEELVNRVLEEHKPRPHIPITQSEERTPLQSPSEATQLTATGDGDVLPNAPSSPPAAQKPNGWFNWVSTARRGSRSTSVPCPPPTPAAVEGPDGPASPPSETPPSPSLLRRVCRSIQRLSQHLVSPAPASTRQTSPGIDEPAGPGADEDGKASTAHRKSVLFLGPDKLESVTPTKRHRGSSSSSPSEKSESVAAEPESALSTPQPPAPRQSAVKRSRSPRVPSTSPSTKSNSKAGAKRSRTNSVPAEQKQKKESSNKRASPSQPPSQKEHLTVPDPDKPLAESSLASTRSSTSSQGSNPKWQQHLEMVTFIQTNSIKKCLLNFTKADLLKFLHSEGVAHVSEELNKKQLLDEARALVNK